MAAPASPSPWSRLPRGARAALLLLAAVLLAFLNVGIITTSGLAEGEKVDVVRESVTELTGTLTLLLVLLPVLPLMRRLPVEGPRWPSRALLHAALSVLVGTTHTLLMWASRSLLFPLLGWGRYDYGDMRYRFLMEYQKQLPAYALVYGLVAFAAWIGRSREAELAAATLARQLSEARLSALRRQLEPHFLFNALNTVAAFVREDPARAEAMLGHLAAFLRETLRHADAAEVPLGQELQLLASWLEVMRARFEDRLDVAVDAPPETHGVLVPQLVLQPLVENAVRHAWGLGPLRVRVTAERSGGRLRLLVTDSGPGLDCPVEEALSRGTGLSNTARRLRALHGEAQRLDLASAPGGGLAVTVEVPWREAA